MYYTPHPHPVRAALPQRRVFLCASSGMKWPSIPLIYNKPRSRDLRAAGLPVLSCSGWGEQSLTVKWQTDRQTDGQTGTSLICFKGVSPAIICINAKLLNRLFAATPLPESNTTGHTQETAEILLNGAVKSFIIDWHDLKTSRSVKTVTILTNQCMHCKSYFPPTVLILLRWGSSYQSLINIVPKRRSPHFIQIKSMARLARLSFSLTK